MTKKKLQLRRGTFANLPDLDEGEPGWVTDKKLLYIGDSSGSQGCLIGGEGVTIYPENYGAVGDGVTDDGAAITAAIAAVPTGGVLTFQTKTYAYATSPNFGVSYLKIRGNGATLKHTGTGNAMTIDKGAAGNHMGMHVSNLTVEGCATSDYGIYLRSIHHSQFDDVKVTGCAVTGDALRIEFAVCNQWNNFRVSSNETFAVIPLNGIVITRRGAGTDHASTQTFINPVIEGVSGAGIYIAYGYNNRFIGGTSESNDIGLEIVTGGFGANYFEGTDFESNATYDIYIHPATGGNYNTFVNTYASGTSLIDGGYNTFVGGTFAVLTIGNYTYNRLIGVLVYTTFTDNCVSKKTDYTDSRGPAGILLTNMTIAPADLTLNEGAGVVWTLINLVNSGAGLPTGTKWVWGYCYSGAGAMNAYIAPVDDGTGYIRLVAGAAGDSVFFRLPVVTEPKLWYKCSAGTLSVVLSGWE